MTVENKKIDILGDLVKAYIAAPVKRCQKLHDDIINSLNLLCEWFGSETDIRKLVILESGKKNTVQTYKLLYDGDLSCRKFFLGLKTAETVDTADNQ